MLSKILLVEDNLLNQRIVSYYLKKENYTVVACDNGEKAIELYQNEWFEVVLMDIMLPGINGFDSTKAIRIIEKEIYPTQKTFIIALTANTLDNDREKCLQNGMDEYLPKPFDIQKLRPIFETLNLI